MDELETRVAERLVAPTAEATPPVDLAKRVTAAVEARRRHRRRVRLSAAAAVLAVLAVPVGLLLRGEPSAPELRRAPDLTPMPTRRVPTPPQAPAAPAELDQFVDRSSASVIPVQLSNGLLFRAEALGPTGFVVGATGFDADPYRNSDGQVWVLGLGTSRPVAMRNGSAWAYVASDSVVAWAEYLGDGYEFQLMCVDLSERTLATRQVSQSGVAKWSLAPILLDGTTFVWPDEPAGPGDTEQLWTVDGCRGGPRPLSVTDLVVAVVSKKAYVVDRADGVLRSFGLNTGAEATVTALPADLWADEHPDPVAQFGVTAGVVVWANDRTLTVLDRRTGISQQVTTALPEYCELKVGDSFVVCSQRLPETSPIDFAAFVYDLRTGESVTLASEALTAGDLLLWREGTNYVIAPARQPG